MKKVVAAATRRLHGLSRGIRSNLLALARRRKLRHVTFIGVTGSCGKTTTAALTSAVLESAGPCCLGADDNSLRAVIKNVLSVSDSTKFCVQEISGSRFGRVATHCKILQPQIGIVTTIGGDHYKNFRSLEATAQSKSQLVELLPSTGTAILNADDPHVLPMAMRTRARVVTYGLSPEATVRGSEVGSVWPDRLGLTVTHNGQSMQVKTKLVGEYWATSVLAAIACGIACGLDFRTCAEAVEKFEPLFGRCSVHPIPHGPVYVFDHKNPLWNVPRSLDFLKKACAPRKTVVFGTISDYASKGGRTYRKVARQASGVASRVVFVGPHARHVSELCHGEFEGRLFSFATTYQASAFLGQDWVPGELILVKNSADHLERLMLSQLNPVVCWRERCGRRRPCVDCDQYRIPKPPPFGLDGDERSGA